MSAAVLVLRPEPGAGQTAERLTALGFVPIVYPLFAVEAVDWALRDTAGIDSILLTSANAARFGGSSLAPFHDYPVYAVGAATARAARAAGFSDVRQGGGDVAATVPLIARAGHAHVLHPGGEHVRAYDHQGLEIERATVYRTVPRGDAAGLAAVLPQGQPCALVHSPRAGARLAELVAPAERPRLGLAVISAAAAEACGSGWRAVGVAAAPDENALLQCLQMLV